jgi:hypothetical protein
LFLCLFSAGWRKTTALKVSRPYESQRMREASEGVAGGGEPDRGLALDEGGEGGGAGLQGSTDS